jgi:hypothetical protein
VQALALALHPREEQLNLQSTRAGAQVTPDFPQTVRGQGPAVTSLQGGGSRCGGTLRVRAASHNPPISQERALLSVS